MGNPDSAEISQPKNEREQNFKEHAQELRPQAYSDPAAGTEQKRIAQGYLLCQVALVRMGTVLQGVGAKRKLRTDVPGRRV